MQWGPLRASRRYTACSQSRFGAVNHAIGSSHQLSCDWIRGQEPESDSLALPNRIPGCYSRGTCYKERLCDQRQNAQFVLQATVYKGRIIMYASRRCQIWRDPSRLCHSECIPLRSKLGILRAACWHRIWRQSSGSQSTMIAYQSRQMYKTTRQVAVCYWW